MGLLGKKPEKPELIVATCKEEHVYMYFGPKVQECYFCMLSHTLEAGRLLNQQKLELIFLAKQHMEEWFKYLEENPNEVIHRAATRQSTELLAMVNRHKREQDVVTKKMVGE